MKKIILGVLALSQVAALAAGYVKTDSSFEIKSNKELTTAEEKKIQEKLQRPSYEVKPNLDLGLLFGKNNEAFLFAGGELKKTGEEKKQ